MSADSGSPEDMFSSLNLKSEHTALETINRLETAVFAWKERITEQVSTKSPVRTSWSFIKDPMAELDKVESVLNRAETLLQKIKGRYPNLPQTFLDATKIQYGKVSWVLASSNQPKFYHTLLTLNFYRMLGIPF